MLLDHNVAVEVHDSSVRIMLDVADADLDRAVIEVDAKFVDHGSDIRLAIAPDSGGALREPDPVLVRLVVQAFAARDSTISGKPEPMTDEFSRQHRTRLARLSFLAPDIITAIIEGRQPPALNGRRLLRAANLPHD